MQELSMQELSLAVKNNLQYRYKTLQDNIALACQKAKIEPKDITLVAVSKRHSVEEINYVHHLGQNIFAENYVQEALEKQEALAHEKIVWHYTGPIQSNKIKNMHGNFALIHSLSENSHALKLNALGSEQKVLLQVNIGNEEQKSGCDIKLIEQTTEYILSLSNLKLQGLMCITPKVDKASESRPYFALLYELREKLRTKFNLALPELSMGMSSDYAEAILEGASIIRVGTQIFA